MPYSDTSLVFAAQIIPAPKKTSPHVEQEHAPTNARKGDAALSHKDG